MSQSIYTVREGDTLSGIGVRVGVPWRKLAALNAEVLRGNPDLIYPGDVLRLSRDAPASPSADRLAVERVQASGRE